MSSTRRSLSPSDIALLVLVNILWGASAVAAKVAMGGISGSGNGHLQPHTVAAIRFGIAGLLLFAYQRSRGEVLAIQRQDRSNFIALGLLGTTVTYSLFYAGAKLTTATEMNLLVAAEPILIALLGWWLLREQLSKMQAVGLFLGFCGVYLIVAQGLFPKLGGSLMGNGLVLLALTCESFGAIIAKRLAATYSGLTVVIGAAIPGTIALLPMAAWELRHHPPVLDTPSTLGVAYLVLVCSTFCYGVWFQYVPRFSISTLGVFLFIQPIVSPLYGFYFLGETLPTTTAIGAAVTLVGVWLVTRTSSPENSLPEPIDCVNV